jgi:hypothetical protein
MGMLGLRGKCHNCQAKCGQLWLDLHRGLCGKCWKRYKNKR